MRPQHDRTVERHGETAIGAPGQCAARHRHGVPALTARQERFAACLASGMTGADAYRAAYGVDWTPASIHVAASRLRANAKVALRVERLRKQVHNDMANDAVAIRRHVIARLIEESQAGNGTSASARIRALELLGKLDIVRLFDAQTDHCGHDERAPDELKRAIIAKLEEWMTG